MSEKQRRRTATASQEHREAHTHTHTPQITHRTGEGGILLHSQLWLPNGEVGLSSQLHGRNVTLLLLEDGPSSFESVVWFTHNQCAASFVEETLVGVRSDLQQLTDLPPRGMTPCGCWLSQERALETKLSGLTSANLLQLENPERKREREPHTKKFGFVKSRVEQGRQTKRQTCKQAARQAENAKEPYLPCEYVRVLEAL
jgi:hypothetical protein